VKSAGAASATTAAPNDLMGFIVGADLQTRAKPGLKSALIPVFAAADLG
jgi:hypothetical protein